MGLIYWLNLQHREHNAEKLNTSAMYGEIEKKYLSDPYNLRQFSTMEAQLLNIRKGGTFWEFDDELRPYLFELQKEPIKLTLIQYQVLSDRLYFDNETWNRLRDVGILRGHSIQIKIDEVNSRGENIKIYPIRDVIP